jgi:hypothetical protein
VDEPGHTAPKAPVGAPKPSTRRGRAPLIFAIVGVAIALAAGGLYVVKIASAPARLTPEETVQAFLSAVFLAGDGQRVGAVICSSWDPSDAIARTTKEIETGAHVSWDEVAIVAINGDKASAKARLGLRLRDDNKPSVYRQWRFSLIDENGWRVCEARPFT